MPDVKAFACPGATNPEEKGNLKNAECVVHKKYNTCFEKGLRACYIKDKIFKDARLKRAMEEWNYKVVVELDFPPGCYQKNKKGKRDKTNLDFKKLVLIVVQTYVSTRRPRESCPWANCESK